MRDWPPKILPHYPAAVFLDRDGTINVDTHFPHRVESLQLVPSAVPAFPLLALLPLHIIVVSNQAGIALGLYDNQAMSVFNRELRSRVEDVGGRIDAFYYCPHREPKHLRAGEISCECAKPAPGLLLEAAKDFNLELSSSFMIGDRLSDVQAGKAVGCTTFLIGTATSVEQSDLIVPDLSAAARVIEEALAADRISRHARGTA